MNALVAARRPGALLVGLGVTVLYAIVCVATLRLTGHEVRPVFEGIGPDSPYRWVNPPKEFAPGNVKPEPLSTELRLDAAGSQAVGLTSGDSQMVVNLAAGAVPVRPSDDRVVVTFVPLDPATLGRLPPPLRPAGNAYRVELTYRPSRQPVTALDAPGDVLLLVPEPVDTLLFSRDGQAWTRIATRHEPGSVGESASFADAGYYVAGTSRPPPSAVAPPGRGYGTVAVVVAVAVVAVALAWTPYVVSRRRAARPAAKPPAKQARPEPSPRASRRRRR